MLAVVVALPATVGAEPAAARRDPGPQPQAAVVWRPVLCTLPLGKATLPAGARRGLIGHLRQYPELSLAAPRERGRARALLARIRAVAAAWPTAEAAATAGYQTGTAHRAASDRLAHYLHAEKRRERRSATFDVRHPKALIFANEPGGTLTLVGVMYSVKRGRRGPSPGGPITRWHSHEVCVRGNRRGLRPRDDGSCAAGERLTQGSEMMHVWFTRDVRSAFAVRAPERELCRDGLLAGATCRDPRGTKGM